MSNSTGGTRPGVVFRSTPPKVGFEQGITLEQVATDVYESKQLPWTWPDGPVVPGGLIAALAANAAWETVTSDFVIDMLSVQWINGPSPKSPMQMEVVRLNDGGRFATRLITTRQAGRVISHVTCSFIRASAFKGPSMSHAPQRATKDRVSEITLDDLDANRSDLGPWMRAQRLSLTNDRTGEPAEKSLPEHLVHSFVATIFPSLKSPDSRIQALGIIALSDFHVVDGPPVVNHLSLGSPEIGDRSRRPTKSDFNLYTSLNHAIYFHKHEGFRADEMVYCEARSPWSGRRRGLIESRIFDGKDGSLIATCTQEGYYVLKDQVAREKL